MTIQAIKSVAIVGAGPGGLAAAYEFLHNTAAFDKVVVFEQKSRVGGVWASELEADKLETLDEGYWDPKTIHPPLVAPQGVEHHTVENPLEVPALENGNQWRKSGVYPDLFTNVPKRFMRFSSIPYEPQVGKSSIGELMTHHEVFEVLDKFADEHSLKDHIRFNTQVQDVEKVGFQWTLTLRNTGKVDKWYTEQFDAVVVASGHYSTPYIPQITGLSTRSPATVSHSKSFRNPHDFKDKTVVIVGSSLSGIDIAQYLNPIANVIISRTPGKKEIYDWLERAALDSVNKPRIQEIQGDVVKFIDGSEVRADHIIFATGYHWHWPFLNKLEKFGVGETSTGASRVKGLYYHTFSIEDSTLGFVGVTLGATKFHSLEAGAAALAGVWSGQRSLPSREEQLQWERQRLEETNDNALFHYYTFHEIKEKWFDEVIERFAAPGRANPLDGEDVTDIDRGLETAERVYFEFKDGKLRV